MCESWSSTWNGYSDSGGCTVVGAVAGFGIGYIGAKVYDSIVTEDLKEMASEFVEEGAEYIKDCVGGFFSKVGEAIGTW